MSSREPDSPHVSSSKVSASKVRVTEVRFREVGVLEVRAAQIRLLEYGTGCLTAPKYHDAPTDLFVHERLHLTPLGVSADRIPHVALRCAVLLAISRTRQPGGQVRIRPCRRGIPGRFIAQLGLYSARLQTRTSTDAVD